MLNESEATELYPFPVSLDEPPLPDFSEEAFPAWLNDMVNAVARHTETPRGLAAMNGLAVLGTCCQKKFQVSPKPGYIEPTNIWVMAAMESGNRKTAVLNEMTAPLSVFEKNRQEQMDPEQKRIESERATRQARIDHLRQKTAQLNSEDFEDKMREIAQLEESLPEVPHVPRLWAQDITPEQLGPLMAENNEKLSLISDEGGIFETFAGRYNDSNPNLDLLLKSHSGSDVRIDRRSRPPLMLSTPALTIGVSPQPEVLRGLTKKQGFRGRGLLARFWYMLPSSPLGYRTGECPPIPPDVLSTYKSSIFALLEMNSNTNEYGQPIPHILTFTDQAHHKWKHFFLTVEKDLQPGGRFEFIKDWAGKLPGAAARIAGLLHCAKHVHGEPGKEQIDLDTMTQALNIAEVLCEHALYAFDVMEADPVLEDARWVWRWIERERETYFSARDCFQALKGKFRFMKNLNPALLVLLERHYIYNGDPDELAEKSNEKRRGRRSSPIYFVNPHLTEGWE